MTSRHDTVPDKRFEPPRPAYRSCERCGVRIGPDSTRCRSCNAVDIITGDTSWMADGLCAQVDPDLWHPLKGGNDGTVAKRVCNGQPERGTAPCPVRDACLEHALTHHEWGVWGGTSDRDRREIRKRRSDGEGVAA